MSVVIPKKAAAQATVLLGARIVLHRTLRPDVVLDGEMPILIAARAAYRTLTVPKVNSVSRICLWCLASQKKSLLRALAVKAAQNENQTTPPTNTTINDRLNKKCSCEVGTQVDLQSTFWNVS